MIAIAVTCFVAPLLHAKHAPAIRPADAFEPPEFADAQHVVNGCHVSATAYLARFAAAFPAEHSEPLVVFMSFLDGPKSAHTLALVSWHGQWWCRDDYFGVFALNYAVDGAPNYARLRMRAVPLLQKRKKERLQSLMVTPPPSPPEHLTTAERMNELRTSAQLMPCPSRLFEVRTEGADVPVLLFRPSARQVAVYEPLHGTCFAYCEISNDEEIVALLVAEFGYRVEAVQPLGTTTTASALRIADGS